MTFPSSRGRPISSRPPTIKRASSFALACSIRVVPRHTAERTPIPRAHRQPSNAEPSSSSHCEFTSPTPAYVRMASNWTMRQRSAYGCSLKTLSGRSLSRRRKARDPTDQRSDLVSSDAVAAAAAINACCGLALSRSSIGSYCTGNRCSYCTGLRRRRRLCANDGLS